VLGGIFRNVGCEQHATRNGEITLGDERQQSACSCAGKAAAAMRSISRAILVQKRSLHMHSHAKLKPNLSLAIPGGFQNPEPWFWWIFGLLVLVRLSVLTQFTTHVDDILPLAEAIQNKMNVYSPWEVVKLSRTYTYAPLQFILSLPLAFRLSNNWTELLFWTRAVSFTVWATGVAVGFRVLGTILGPERRPLALLGGLLMIFSLRGAAESSQGYNYATTLILTVGMSWLIVTDRGLALLRRSWWPSFLIGLLFAASVWTTYQAVFIACGFFMTLGLIALWQRDWGLLAKGVFMGTFLCAGLLLVYKVVIVYILGFAQSVPPWPSITLPGTGVYQLATYPLRAFWAAAQNDLTFLPWGWPTRLLTALLLSAGICGAVTGLLRGRLSPTGRRALLWILCSFIALTILGYFKLFALGETRHSFLFQFPLIVLVTLGLSHWEWNPRRLLLVGGVTLVIGACGLSHYLAITRRQADLAWIQCELKSHPEAVITDFPADCSWDFILFAHFDPAELKRMHFSINLPGDSSDPDRAWGDLFKNASIVYVYSHRLKLQSHHLAAINRIGEFKLTRLAETDPVSSAEISGLINAGNGFYFYKFERQ
jgi:hypothetical protein